MGIIVEYKDVELHRNDIVALKHVNLTVSDGEFVYLTGKVGSGKSSLMKSMYAEIPIASGQADVLGYDMCALKRKDIPYLRRQIGIVFQDFRLLSDRSVYDNLRFVLNATGWKNKVDIEERIEQVLKEVGMSNKSYKMPYELSGGEQQRIVIARALLNRPSLILADEPTGNLDQKNSKEIMDMLGLSNRSLNQTILLITHDEKVALEAERIITVQDGRIVSDERREVKTLSAEL